MSAPINYFKQKLQKKIPQMGCWVALANAYTAEIVSTAGFDWLLIDGEHAPNDMRSIMAQLQVIEHSNSHAVVRIAVGDQTLIKQVLDIGCQTVLVPMVDSADQARELVKNIQYPPMGNRGVGASLGRASRFSGISPPEYLKTAGEQICLLVQIETVAGLNALDDILQIERIDGVFVGPSDLSADMGYIGNPSAPQVQHAVDTALTKIIKSGKSAGILTLDISLAQKYVDMGVTFVAIGADVLEFAKSIRALAKTAKSLTNKEGTDSTNKPKSSG